MESSVRAYSVHLLTATGAALAMLALVAAVAGDWRLMFLWLLLAFVVDGVDGPLARRYRVKDRAPIIDGALLDLIVDYLTYVFVPAFALLASGIVPGWMGWTAIIVITFGSALYFADTRMKTSEDSFSGFPACWNMVVLVLFVLQPPPAIALAVVLVLSIAMFVPVTFVHPVRTRRWRAVTLPVAFVWVVFAAWAVLADFTEPAFATWALVGASLYLLVAGAVQQATKRR